MNSCAARQYSDQMHCHRCGLIWDMNDPDPPKCNPKLEQKLDRKKIAPKDPVTKEVGRRALQSLRELLPK